MTPRILLAASLAVLAVGATSASGCRGSRSGFVAVSACESHNVALKANGAVWTWGQISTETERRTRPPAPLVGVPRARAAAAAPRATLVLAEDSSVTLLLHASVPEIRRTFPLAKVGAVSAGRSAGAALTADGHVHVFCVGSESCPVADEVATEWPGVSDATQIAVGDGGLLVIRRDGTAAALSFEGGPPVAIEGLSRVASIAAGGRRYAAVTADGGGWSWDSRSTRAERVPGLARAARVRAGDRTTYFILDDGRVMAVGDNRWGQLGRPASAPIDGPIPLASYAGVRDVAAGTSHTLVATREGGLEGLGGNVEAQLGRVSPEFLVEPQRLEQPAQLAAASLGYDVSLFLTRDGEVWAAGRNSDGQLGIGFWSTGVSPPARLEPLPAARAVSAGSTHSLALLRDGTLRAWGRNDQGSLGDGSREPRLAPADVAGPSDVAEACAGGDVSLAVTRDGALWRWGGPGGNPDGADDADDVVPRRLRERGWTSVRCNDADRTAVLLRNDGTVWQLPAEPDEPPARVAGLARITAIASSDGHALALGADGRVHEWHGFDTPRLVELTNVAAVAAGSQHAVARRTDGSVWTWGRNTMGQLCSGSREDAERPAAVAAEARDVAAGYESTLIVRKDGSAWVCGWNVPRIGAMLAASHVPLPIPLEPPSARRP